MGHSRMGRGIRRLSTAAALAIPLVFSNSLTAADNYSLPTIGDPSSAALPRAEEEKLGRIILAEIRKQLPVINDPELRLYLQSLGSRLLSAGVSGEQDFTFLLIQDSGI